tara:strand:- start:13161 stop:13910 length:750 start_codon:yes stop_codon:yes gene_type:complete
MKKAVKFESGLYNDDSVLILGAPRSGTTLLAAMISSHPEACILMEDYYGGAFRILSKKVSGVKLCTPNQIKFSNAKVPMYFKKIYNLGSKLLSRMTTLNFATYDTPSEYSISDYINLTENLLIIYIIRNPVDAIKSEVKRNNVSLNAASQQWRESIDICLKTKEMIGEDKVFCIDYESLVNSPEKAINELLNFLGLEFDKAVMEGFKHTPQYAQRKGIEVNDKRSIPASEKAKFKVELDLYRKFSQHIQ